MQQEVCVWCRRQDVKGVVAAPFTRVIHHTRVAAGVTTPANTCIPPSPPAVVGHVSLLPPPHILPPPSHSSRLLSPHVSTTPPLPLLLSPRRFLPHHPRPLLPSPTAPPRLTQGSSTSALLQISEVTIFYPASCMFGVILLSKIK